MKKLFILIIAVSLSSALSAQGIKFFDGTFEDALVKAKQENKKVFVDVYTD